MKRFAVIFALFALVLAACGDGSGGSNGATAATVDGTVITVGDVEDLMSDEESVVDRPSFAQFLGAAIQIEVLGVAADADFGVAPTDEEVAVKADELYAVNGIDMTREEFLNQAGISELMLAEIATQQLIIEEVKTELDVAPTEEQLAAARQRAEWESAEVCAAHVLVPTEEEALDVIERVDSGEDFGEVAMEVSTDTASGEAGGDLGCSPPARYVEPFAEATMTIDLDTPSDPVESQFGYHVIVVSDRTEADPDDLPSDEELTSQLQPALEDEAYNDWYAGALAAAEVEVVAEYGTWSAGPPPQVIPPA